MRTWRLGLDGGPAGDTNRLLGLKDSDPCPTSRGRNNGWGWSFVPGRGDRFDTRFRVGFQPDELQLRILQIVSDFQFGETRWQVRNGASLALMTRMLVETMAVDPASSVLAATETQNVV